MVTISNLPSKQLKDMSVCSSWCAKSCCGQCTHISDGADRLQRIKPNGRFRMLSTYVKRGLSMSCRGVVRVAQGSSPLRVDGPDSILL